MGSFGTELVAGERRSAPARGEERNISAVSSSQFVAQAYRYRSRTSAPFADRAQQAPVAARPAAAITALPSSPWEPRGCRVPGCTSPSPELRHRGPAAPSACSSCGGQPWRRWLGPRRGRRARVRAAPAAPACGYCRHHPVAGPSRTRKVRGTTWWKGEAGSGGAAAWRGEERGLAAAWAGTAGGPGRDADVGGCWGRPADRRCRAGWREAVAAAAGTLQAGGLVAVPTDTVYGVACLAQDSGAVRSIYSLKGRNGAKPLAICLGDVDHLYRYCHVNVPDELLRDLLPGPVTLVLKRSEELNKDLNPFTSLVGVRVPNHPFIRELARACSGPLALTSANVSCQGSTLAVSEFQDLWPQLSLIIDGGPTGDIQSPECRLGSTVVDLSVSGKFTIIRPGCALASTVEILRQKYGLVPESP
ncbi:LOW QUALITY PROTEIN: threonylcarbamoyl-AMP synthase [Indicator indicator]|uniref:LOW QUALITY PROTEIN: threonylcarbamoyl-AMP synthase n=1 Tax=Indicator indicator TaxID=1002788 RepID=UPI0023DF03B8|nr:LOW QUALITY PROTEIN: threonylcarbamoyl-AMP synthase [Indicator indicator]